MGIVSILSEFQTETLSLFKKTPLAKSYYLAGGTALAEYYLHHRKSEDLDFFTQDELSLPNLQKFVGSIQSHIQLDKIEYQHGFGLYTFFLYPKKEVAKYKIDFGQYPFSTINPLKKIDDLLVEDLYDIAVDKAHTISVRPRLRDFIDLFLILRNNKSWSLEELLRRGQEKFEISVDPLQLGENLLQVRTLSDMPIMLQDIDMKEIKKYFIAQAAKQRRKIFR
jgi:predicted nucleotidyltransferase component of viral defense system